MKKLFLSIVVISMSYAANAGTLGNDAIISSESDSFEEVGCTKSVTYYDNAGNAIITVHGLPCD